MNELNEKEITHEVCKKIREIINQCDFIIKDGFYYIKQIELNDKIDNIEEGVNYGRKNN